MGTMKAGAAYVPLDPSLPRERLRLILNDASIGIVLSQERFREKLAPLPADCPGLHSLLCLDGPRDWTAAHSRERSGTGDAGSPAYVMYTSGSSGVPKGVLVEHRTIVNTLWWRKDFYRYNPDSVSLQNPPYFFDSSVTDIFTPLLGGARLVLIEESERKNLAALRKLIVFNRVTHFIVVPAFYNILLEEIGDSLRGVKIVCAAGEYFPDELVKKHFKMLPGVRITNEYGPTENSVNTTIYELKPDSTKALIGKPTWNVGVFILDRHMNLCPIGVGGEIWLIGSSLARGYLNNPELTAEKFNRSYKSYRTYSTGDLGRWSSDGNLEFLGRVDTQVKIRGMRIETGEIESHLMRHGGIKEAVVLARESASGGEKYLCAYIVPDGAAPAAPVLTEFLSQTLPGYMIPSFYVAIETIPFTPSGKIDRSALPEPEMDTGVEFIAPRDEKEKKLVEIWTAVLGKSFIGIDENFFAVGGDSIKAIQIISRLNTAGYKTDIRTLFRYPTARELAPKLTGSETFRDQSPVTGRVLLSPIQEWFFGWLPVYPHHFNHAVMFYSRERIDPDALKAVFKKIQEHHDALRMTYKREIQNGETRIVQENHGLDYPLFFAVHDFRGRSSGPEALEEAAAVIQAGIDLETGPLMKPALFRLDDGDRLLIVIHHLVIDGISWRILFEDIDRLMRQYNDNISLELPPKTDSFKTWTEKLSEYAGTDAFLKEKTYWEELGALPVKELQKDIEGGDNVVKDAASASFQLSPAETEALLTKVNHAFGTKINDILLTALGLAVKKTWSRDRLFIYLEGHGREDLFEGINVSRTVGWFTNNYPVLLDVSFESDPGRQVKEIKETLRRVPGKGIGYGILKYLTPADIEGGAKIEIHPSMIFNYLGQFDADLKHGGWELAKEPAGVLTDTREKRQYELEVFGIINRGCLAFTAVYSKKQYKPGTIERFVENFKSELIRLIGFCTSREKRESTPSDFTYPHLSIEAVDRLGREYPGSIEDIYPLTPMQQGMLFLSLYDTSSEAYFEQFSYRLHGDLDVRVVEKSINELFKRQEVLRTAIIYRDVEKPLQVVLGDRRVEFYYEDFRGPGDREEREAFIAEFKVTDRQRSFDLSNDVLMRVSIIQANESEYEFIWSVHHILMDGWCAGILITEFFEIYTAFLEQRAYRLPPVTPFREYIKWLQKQNREDSLDYWKDYLGSYEETVFVPGKKSRRGRDGKVDYKNEIVRLEFDRETTAKLTGAAGANHVTVNTFIQSAWAVLLGKYNGKEDVVFGSVVSGRPAGLEGVESMVGLFINTIPVRIRFGGELQFSRLLHRVQEDAVAGEAHHYFPLADIQSGSLLKQDLINHILVFENYPLAEQIEGYENKSRLPLKISDLETFEQTNYDFEVIIDRGEQLAVRFNFNGNVFDRDVVDRLAGHFFLLVDRVIDNTEIEIDKLSLLSDREKHRVLHGFNDTKVWYPADKTIHRLFEDQVLKTPDAAALHMSYRTHMTYKELNRRSDGLASLLLEKGVLPGMVVGIKLGRSVEMIIGIFGILKAGGAYLPIDPGYPEERSRYMLEDSSAKILVTTDTLTEKCGTPELNSSHLPDSSSPAYVIYTSGTTGVPRGVMVEHRSVVNLIVSRKRRFNMDSGDRVLQFSSICFDASVEQIFVPLCSGAEVVLAGKETLLEGDGFETFLSRRGITHLDVVPAFLAHMKPGGVKHLKRLVIGGETCPVGLAKQWCGRRDFYNAYGLTETTVTSIELLVKEVDTNGAGVPIGRPISNTVVYLLDSGKNPVPVGAVGELYIGGAGVARGYINRPELTAETFSRGAASSFLTPLYRTGDLGRWRSSGTIEFLGRIDQQVKIRGFRVELGEIETRLAAYPGIKDTVVISRNDRGRQYLCAYFSAEPSSAPGVFSVNQLKGHLEKKLPDYMLPSCFVNVENIPLTINGKVDVKELPRPLESDFHTFGGYEAPQSDMQQIIAETWKEVLGRETVGIRDNFFDLGGNSLDFVTIGNKLRAKLGKDIPVVTLFTYPTIRSLEHFLIGDRDPVEKGDDPGLVDEGKDFMHLAINKLDTGD